MRKLLFFVIPILILACSEDKDSRNVQADLSATTRSTESWTIEIRKETFALGEFLDVSVNTGSDTPTNVAGAELEMKTESTNNEYVIIASSHDNDLDFGDVYAFKLGMCYLRAKIWMQPKSETPYKSDTIVDKKVPSVILDYGDGETIDGGHERDASYVLSYAGSHDQRL